MSRPNRPNPPHTIHSKVVILGESSVGKTSVVMRGSRDEFYEFQEPTIGAAFLTTARQVNDIQVKLELWDTAGQERYRSLAPMYYRGATVAIIVYDITQPDSLVRAREWAMELQYKMPGKQCGLVLVGNKCDLGVVDHDMAAAAEEVVRDHSVIGADPVQHRLVSAKTGDGVEELFVHVCEMVYGVDRVEGNCVGGGDGGISSNGFVLSGGGSDDDNMGYVDRMRGMCG